MNKPEMILLEGGLGPEGRHGSDAALFDGNGRYDDLSDLKLDPAEVERRGRARG